MKKFGDKIIDSRRRAWLYCLAFCLSILPMIAISFYDHPSADDFNYSVLTRRIWLETGSLLQVMKAAARTTVYYFNEWQGLYVSPFLQALQPAIFGESVYAAGPLFLLAVHMASTLFFFYVLVRKVLGGTRFQWMELSGIGLFLMVQLMPSAVEGFYWYNGAVNYTFFYALLMTMAGLSWYCDQTERKGVRAGLTVLLILMGFVLAGGNQVTSFAGILFYLVCGAVRGIGREKKKSFPLLLTGLSITAGFILNVTAPGTAVRQATCLDRPGVAGTILMSISYTLIYMTDWLHPFFLVCLAAAVPSAWGAARSFRRKTGFSYPCPLAAVIAAGAVMTAMYCPSNYAQGFSGNYRLINVTYFIFVILMVILLIYLLGWISVKLENKGLSAAAKDLEKSAGRISLKSAAVYIFIFMVLLYPVRERLSGFNALTSLANGKAARYDSEADARVALIMEADEDEVIELEPFTVKPKVLFFEDLDRSQDNWKNQAMAEYYGRRGIVLKEE